MLFLTILTEQIIFKLYLKIIYIFECLIHYCIHNKFFSAELNWKSLIQAIMALFVLFYLKYFKTMLK